MGPSPTAPAPPVEAAPGPDAGDGLAIPRPEHPRPDLRRDVWLNLNGTWRFSFDPQNRGEQQRWYRIPPTDVAARTGEVSALGEDPFTGHIVVPFPWESRLSGVTDPGYKGAAWYQRVIEAPLEWAEPGAPPPPVAAPAAAPPPGAG